MDNLSALIVAVALMCIMFGMGLSLTVNDFKRIVREPRAVLIGLTNQLILVPLIGFALVSLLDLSPAVSIGIMILVACPGGATSNLISHLARGDTALSVTLTAVASLITVITIPLIIRFALSEFQGEDRKVTLDVFQTIGQLLMIVVVPVAIGMIIRARATAFALKMDKPVRVASGVLLAVITLALIVKERSNIIPYLEQAGLPTVLLCVTTMVLGFFSARLFRLKTRQAVSISIESGIQNSALAITIATVTLQDTGLGIAAAIYTLIMYVAGFGAILYGRKAVRAESVS
ncbi:MAG: bile acid:sodium symporter family protein [Roseivirga sp.]|nr:bile acid:sodium symporter family protein [Roseivirga sp.]